VLHSGIGWLASSDARKPIRHVGWFLIAHEAGWEAFVPAEENVLHGASALYRRIVLVISFFLDHLPARTAFAAVVDHGGLLAHDAGETRRIIAKAGGVADQRAARVGEERVEGVGIFASVRPRENTAAGDGGFRIVFVQEKVTKINPVAHPLVGNAAGEFLVKPKLKIELRIEWAMWLGH